MSRNINDVVSRLISGPVSPVTLAKLLRVSRNDVAEWALALAPVAEGLHPVLLSFDDLATARCDIDFESLADQWHVQSEQEWRRSLDHWVSVARHWPRGHPSGLLLAGLRPAVPVW